MRKIAKLLTVAAVAAAGAFFALNRSNEIIYGNIEALTGGETGSSGPVATLVRLGRKATKEEIEASKKPILGITLPTGFSEVGAGTHKIGGTNYKDCGTYTYGYVVFDKDYGKCLAWKINTSGTSPLGAYTVCPYHH